LNNGLRIGIGLGVFMDANLIDKLIYDLSKSIERYSTIYRFANHDDKEWASILKVASSNIENKKRNLFNALMISIEEEEDE
jgi:hypothetical protein